MYEEIFRSASRPFRATPDTKFYFPHDSIDSARKSTVRAIERAEGPVLIMGGAGLGKSLLAELVAEDVCGQFDMVRLSAARLCSRRALLQNILFELGLPYRELSEGELRLSLLDRLEPSSSCSPDGIVIIVDEAHTLPEKLLEELRLISNFTRDNQPRARLVLIGGMQLEDIFARPQMESFNQRLAARCYLSPMNRQQTHEYVEHQIRAAGYQPGEFLTSEAQQAVYSASDGIPRLVNQVMDHTLVLAVTNRQCPASASLVEQAWADLQQLPLPWQTTADQQASSSSGAESNIEFGSLVDEDGEADSAVDFELPIRHAQEGTTTADLSTGPLSADSEPAPRRQNAQQNAQPRDGASIQPKSTTSLFHFGEDTSSLSGQLEEASQINGPGDEDASIVFEELSSGDFAAPQNVESIPGLDGTLDPDSARSETEQNNFFAAFTEPEPGELPVEEEPVLGINAQAVIPLKGFEMASDDDLAEQLLQLDSDIDLTDIDIDVPTVLPSDSFFDDRETDEKLLAINEEQNQFAEILSQQSNPLTHSGRTADEIVDPTLRVDLNGAVSSDFDSSSTESYGVGEGNITSFSAKELFGDDFEEEFPIDNRLQRHPQSNSDFRIADAPNNSVTQKSATSDENQLAPQDSIAENTRTPNDPKPTPQTDEEIAVEPSMLTGAPAATPWSVDVLASENEMQLDLQSQIEELISQMNFSGESTEFSVEQINVSSTPNSNSKTRPLDESLGQSQPSAIEDTPITRNDDQEGDAARSNLFGVHWSSYEDDRDLLIIDEQVPTHANESVPKPKSKAKRTSYTQLFAKLRK